jgi:hypothetical protein
MRQGRTLVLSDHGTPRIASRISRSFWTQRLVGPKFCSRSCVPNEIVTKIATILESLAPSRLTRGIQRLVFRVGLCDNLCDEDGHPCRILTGELVDGLDITY